MKESDLMTRIRLYELAKELGIENKVIVEKARELGFDVKSHMSSLTDDQINKIRELYKNKSDKKRQNKSKIKVSVGALRRTNSNEDNNKKKKKVDSTKNTNSPKEKVNNPKPAARDLLNKLQKKQRQESVALEEQVKRSKKQWHEEQIKKS